MNKLSFDSVAQDCVTFFNYSSLKNGVPCKMHSNQTVTGCSDGDDFIGVIGSTHGTFAGVIVHGFVTLHYSGTAPVLGFTGLAADSYGGVKVLSSGRKFLIVSVDAKNHTLCALI